MAYGGSSGRRVRGESPAVLGCGQVGPWAALQRFSGAFLERGGMDSVVGLAAAVDEGLARSAALSLPAGAFGWRKDAHLSAQPSTCDFNSSKWRIDFLSLGAR